MSRWYLTLGLLGVLVGGVAFADELEDRIQEAREQLDAAAEKLAQLHREMYDLEKVEGRYGKRAMLGVLLHDAGDENGIVIDGVTPGGGGEQAGLQAGDRLVAIGGVRLDASAEDSAGHLLSGVLKALEPGDSTTVEYVRDENLVVTEVTTQAKRDYVMKTLVTELDGFGPDFTAQLSREFKDLEELKELKELGKLQALHDLGDLGELLRNVITIGGPLQLEDVDSDLAGYFGVDRGVLVLSPPTEDSELKAGDILLEVDGGPVTSARDALMQLSLGDSEVLATVLRQGQKREVTIDCADLSRHSSLAISHGSKVIQIRRGDNGGHGVEVEILLHQEGSSDEGVQDAGG